MLIQGSLNTDKTNLLVKKYNDLIKQGILPENILTIVLNPYKKEIFINKLYDLNEEYKNFNLKISTFFGLCYNSFNENWNYISNLLGVEDIEKPNLCGLEVSQFIFKQSIKENDFSDYISKVNLLHQLFRRYSLIVQNCLTKEEIKERSEILGETFYPEAQKAIDEYKLKTNKYKSFDYLRQLAVLPLIYKNTEYFKNIKYLLIDDADEYPYSFWEFVHSVMPFLSDYMIAYDKDGSSRCGYLCAYKNGINDFIKKYNPKIINLNDKSPYYNVAQTFFNNIRQGKKTSLFDYKDSIKRLDMFENVINDIKNLIKNGVKPCDITIVTPLLDEVLIQEFTSCSDIKFQILSGSQKLIDSDFIKHILYIIKLAENITLKDYELKFLMVKLLKIPYRKCIEIIKEYSKTKELKNYKFNNEKYDFGYTKLYSLTEALKKSKKGLSEQIKIIFANLICENDYDKSKYDFLLKEAQSFETAFENSVKNLTQEFILQMENSVISENSSDIIKINPEKVIISTPQKIADYSLKTKYQLWIDISNNEWLKQDTGTLYNSWVFNRDWNKKEYTLEDNINLTRDKTARIVRKLMLCAKNSITFYSSLYDNTGNENFNGLSDFIETEKSTKPEFKIIPRPDQKPVLEYKRGKIGIMAVPGAGKTTILLALIIKLIKTGIDSSNIFVLTFMESAAKNFKERIKSALPDTPSLPNISTIHGLALRIIKENGNYTKLGLDENFEICDDDLKEKIIKEIFYKLKINDEKYDDYLRCISVVKLSGNNSFEYSKYKEINDFYNFLNEYNKTLKQNNMIDYDDMLFFALKLLEENPNILNYYQNLCKYVIEDEAQDSTIIQQSLIKLLTGKYNNFVRCGDINQSITSTFTNSSLEGFKEFINKNKKIEMTTSQRCAKPIYTLANRLIQESIADEEKKEAFYNIQIQGTENNPKTDLKPEYKIFETEKEEKDFILSKTKEIFNKDPEATIAILLRLNYQVNEYSDFFNSNGIKTILRTDCPGQKRIYKIILEVLKTLENPLNNKQIHNLAKVYSDNEIYKFSSEDLDFIKNLKEPFIYTDIENTGSESLGQLFWDIDYWLNNSSNTLDVQALNIGLYYSKNTGEKSNVNLIVSLIRRLMLQSENDIIKRMEYYAQKPSSMYRFFDDECKNNKNGINIMTMHKSKGDEFDYVFCPCMNEENYPVSIEHVKLKTGGHFVQTIKNIYTKEGIKLPEMQKKEQINETLRLIYVGITRAKKGLFLSNAKNYLKRKNTHNFDFFNIII